MAYICRQKFFCDILVETKTKEDHFEKAVPCLCCRLSRCDPGYRLGNSSVDLWPQKQPHLALVLPLSDTIFQRTWQELHLPIRVRGSPTLVLIVDPGAVSSPVLDFLSNSQGEVLPFRDQLGDTPICASRDRY